MKRYLIYAWLVLMLVGLWAYTTNGPGVPRTPNLVMNEQATTTKVEAFNQAAQAAYAQSQRSGQNGRLSLSLSDADASVLLNKQEGSKSNEWAVHFKTGNVVEIWRTSDKLNGIMHHRYEMVMVYNLGSLDNRVSAMIEGINMSGITVPDSVMPYVAGQLAPPTFVFPLGTAIKISSGEGNMLLEMTTSKLPSV